MRRIYKPILLIIIATISCIIYVHQQVELVKISYAIDAKEKKMRDLLDHKESLGYNIAKLESSSRLESVLLAKNIDMAFPKRAEVVSSRRPFKIALRNRPQSYAKAAKSSARFDIFRFFDFFNPRAEAQAKEK